MPFALNGTDQYIDIGNPTQLQITGDMTISMWLKPDVFGARRNPYAKAYGGEGTITQETNGAFNYYYGTDGGNAHPYQGFSSSAAITLNEWSHVVIVRDLTNMQLYWYINGSQVNNNPATYAAAAAGKNSVTLGSGYVSNYSGEISNVSVHSRALSAGEVSTMFVTMGLIMPCCDLEARWPLFDAPPGQGASTVLDIGPNGLHGTPYGNPTNTECGVVRRKMV